MVDIAGLVERARDANATHDVRHAAFAELALRFQDMGYALAFARLHDFHLAQDAVQEALLDAYLGLDTLKQAAAFSGWFRQIVYRKCVLAQKRVGTETALAEAAESQRQPGADPYIELELREQQQAVYRAIAALPEHEREISVLFLLGGYPQQQVADLLDITLAAVKKRSQRAKAHLRRRLGPMAEELFERYRPSQQAGFSTELVDMIRAADPRQAFKVSRQSQGKECLETVALIRARQKTLNALDNDRLRHLMANWRRQLMEDETAKEQQRRTVLPEIIAAGIQSLERQGIAGGQTLAAEDGRVLEALLMDMGQAVALEDVRARFVVAAPVLLVNALAHPPAYLLLSDDGQLDAASRVLEPFCRFWGLGLVTDEKERGGDGGTDQTTDIVCTSLARFGFDYLRVKSGLVAGSLPVLGYGLIDGVDRLICDEAMTPLRIVRPVEGWTAERFVRLKPLVEEMIRLQTAATATDKTGNPFFEVNGYNLALREAGRQWLGSRLPDVKDNGVEEEYRIAEQLVRAFMCYRPEVDYRVRDSRVVILDRQQQEQPGRRFSDGLHQALEAREGVAIQPESEMLAQITYQQVFRLFARLGGIVT